MFEATVWRGRKAAVEPLEMSDELDLGPGSVARRRRAATPLPDPIDPRQTDAGRRRPLLIVVGLVVVLVCAGLGALLASRSTKTAEYLETTHFLPAGARLSPADLEAVSLPENVRGTSFVALADSGEVLNRFAAVPLEAGALLVPPDISGSSTVPHGQALVGATLAADQSPTTLAVGERVLIVLGGASIGQSGGGASSSTASPQSGHSPSTVAGVLAVGTVVDVESSGAAAASGGPATLVTLDVPVDEASAVVQAAAAGDLSLAEIGGVTQP